MFDMSKLECHRERQTVPKYYARTFLPWVLLAVVSGFDVRAGAVTGLVAALALLAHDLRRGRRADSLILEISTTVFLAALTVAAFAAPDSPPMGYGASLAIGWLGVTAWGTLLLGCPFTEGIARRKVSAEMATMAVFRHVNRVLTTVWAVSFTVMAVVLGCVQYWSPDSTALLVAVKIAGFTLPAVFTARYPEIVRRRHLTRSGAPSPEPEPEPATVSSPEPEPSSR
ncbi:hypothetical protein [Actinomadura madurae]|uniref:hypothetical protein n=2 Tax=Actinomadura madurae TaxID=1993 RepID=UPI0020D21A1C|nr:hypothetical protein [Actinomadura madurae]MCP9953627.1 hypothetical protein [Actinomadura madurae]MCP9970380.1 hypothetical protein [Actinomadura madurae]MCP9982862.1 hypothetical protein [Actinomadura madurae]MCQ0005586.1 hypothetical protein [Actinomadura madurae]